MAINRRDKKKPISEARPTKKGQRFSAAKEFASESNYLKGSDIKQPYDDVITGMDKVPFDDGKKKWVHYLENSKPTVLNQTNGRSLAADLGDDMNWVGRTIHISTERRKNPTTGELVPAVALQGADEDLDEEANDVDSLPEADEDEDDDELE